MTRIGRALDVLDIRFLNDGGGSLLAMWERHATLLTLEGPDDEILVMRVHDEDLVELIDCGAAVATSFVDWLHEEGGLL
ncbi:hypothetical protein I4J89_43925 [Actinoplanes sp. NEAU-A11]|uniref:Uncharacterized protein n=1 Tax=Actinoplanes aureus TaxID=2792083 RepID=A0A931G2P6_9ACTN|nr:hypothetical protein [Actinoplanes aureus]